MHSGGPFGCAQLKTRKDRYPFVRCRLTNILYPINTVMVGNG